LPDKTGDAANPARYTRRALAHLPIPAVRGAEHLGGVFQEQSMPITLLDVILLVVMLISALLAMVRGFMREVLSIASWAAAALLTLYAYPRLKPIVLQYFSNDVVASAITIGGVFLGTLLIVSVITIKISDTILDSRVGALDRTLGFLFGLGRGLVIVVVAFIFFDWLVPPRSQPDWVKNAKSLVVLKKTGDTLMSMLPDDPESTILKRLKRNKPEDQDQQEAPTGGRSGLGAPTRRFADAAPRL
jgi:membrane protein required for colicin V production